MTRLSLQRSASPVKHAALIALGFTLSSALPDLRAQTIPNPSFELNTFTVSPGTINVNTPITGWTGSPTNRVGQNPGGVANPFADNGAVPNGTRVAFVQSAVGQDGTLSTTITGLVVGTSYRVQFRANARDNNGFSDPPAPSYRLNGGVPVSFSANKVSSTGVFTAPYRTISGIFTATATTAALEISNSTPGLDSTLLVDNFTISAATAIQVTTLDNDGPGSLRQALIAAAATPAFNVITFAAGLNGQTITLLSEIAIDDAGGVAIDASALTAGITLSGGSNTRILSITGSSLASLRKLTLSAGDAADGGAILNAGTLALTQCTLSGNDSSNDSGAISNSGQLCLTQCTLADNSASSDGGAIRNTGKLTLVHSTVSGNDAGIAGGGIRNDGTLALSNTIVAGNTAPSGADILGVSTGTNNITSGNPLLAALASNGGPTQTMALLPGSPARNAAAVLVPAIAADQRGKAVAGTPDIGAYEVQPGTFALSSTGYSVNEGSGPATVTVSRSGGFEGIVSVKISTTAGTATAPGDFTAITNQTVSFADGVITQDVPVTIANDAVVEANETFTVTLSAPSAGTALGTPVSAKVTIVDPSSLADAILPGLPVVTAPAANAALNVAVGGAITVTGTATDNKGVASVEIDDGNGAFIANATLDTPNAASTGWTAVIVPNAGTNTIKAVATDLSGNSATSAARTFKVLRPLAVQIAGNGSVSAGFSPSSFREVGQKFIVTATPAAAPAPGNIFQNWTIESAHSAGSLGIPLSALEKPTLNFIHLEGLVLRANFVPNPYLIKGPLAAGGLALGANSAGVSGVEYNGLIHADELSPAPNGTQPNNSTEGLLTANVTSSGAFSAKLTIDGSVLSMAGTFDHDGIARFGTSRATTFAVARVNKPSLIVELTIDLDSNRVRDTLFGTVTATSFQRSVILTVSHVTADRAYYDGLSGATSVLPAYLGAAGATQSYTVVLPSRRLEQVQVEVWGVNDAVPGNGGYIVDAAHSLRVGDQITFADPAPNGLTSTDVYTLADDDDVSPDDNFFALKDGADAYVDIDDSYIGEIFTVVQEGDPLGYQPADLLFTTQDYPQGDGYAFLTISKAGVVTITGGKLADGTPLSGSSKLSKDDAFPLFLQLYTKKGYVSGDVALDSSNIASDLAAVNLDWFRPLDSTSHYYPYGWEEVIRVGFEGARYAATFTPASSALRIPDDALGGDPDLIGDELLPVDPASGNAGLSFYDGQLTEERFRPVNVSTTNVVTKVIPTDTSFALTLTGATGLFKGTFVHENDDGVPVPLTTDYEGVLYQKGPGAGGYGFFLTRKPTPIDYTGESGSVNLSGFTP